MCVIPLWFQLHYSTVKVSNITALQYCGINTTGHSFVEITWKPLVVPSYLITNVITVSFHMTEDKKSYMHNAIMFMTMKPQLFIIQLDKLKIYQYWFAQTVHANLNDIVSQNVFLLNYTDFVWKCVNILATKCSFWVALNCILWGILYKTTCKIQW